MRRDRDRLGQAEKAFVHTLGRFINVFFVADEVFRARAVDGNAELLDVLAEVPVLPAARAFTAEAGAVARDQIAGLEGFDLLADSLDHAGPLVAEAHGVAVRRTVSSVEQVDVRAADADIFHMHQHLVSGGNGLGLLNGNDPLRFLQNIRDHAGSSSPLGWMTTRIAPSL